MQFQKSADAKILESVLGEAVVGQTITYFELTQAIGRDVRQFARSALGTARKEVLNTKGIVFDVDQDVGLTRLDDVQIVKSTEKDRLHVSRTTNKSLRKLAVVKYDTLDRDAKRAHVTASAQLGAIAMFSNKHTSKRIESKVTEATTQLSIGETLKLFGG